MKIKFPILLSIFFFLSCFTVACNQVDEYEEVEVSVVSVTTQWGNKVIVRYTVENTGTKAVNGWEIFLNVRMDGGAQLMVSESTYYVLEPGEISKPRSLETRIPTYYQLGSKARNAYLKNIETW